MSLSSFFYLSIGPAFLDSHLGKDGETELESPLYVIKDTVELKSCCFLGLTPVGLFERTLL
jgi:hypothetical protein